MRIRKWFYFRVTAAVVKQTRSWCLDLKMWILILPLPVNFPSWQPSVSCGTLPGNWCALPFDQQSTSKQMGWHEITQNMRDLQSFSNDRTNTRAYHLCEALQQLPRSVAWKKAGKKIAYFAFVMLEIRGYCHHRRQSSANNIWTQFLCRTAYFSGCKSCETKMTFDNRIC